MLMKAKISFKSEIIIFNSYRIIIKKKLIKNKTVAKSGNYSEIKEKKN